MANLRRVFGGRLQLAPFFEEVIQEIRGDVAHFQEFIAFHREQLGREPSRMKSAPQDIPVVGENINEFAGRPGHDQKLFRVVAVARQLLKSFQKEFGHRFTAFR